MEFYLTFRCGDAAPGLRAQLCQAMHGAEERRTAPGGAEEIPTFLQEVATLQQGLRKTDTGNCTQLTQLMGK